MPLDSNIITGFDSRDGLPRKTGAGVIEGTHGWEYVSLDGHRIQVCHYWGWHLEIELSEMDFSAKEHKFCVVKRWHRLVSDDRAKAMCMFGSLCGLFWNHNGWKKLCQ